MARHYENGAVVYGDHNWQKGQPISRYLDSAMRHLNNFHEGDTSEDHLAAAAWNVWAIMWTQAKVLAGKLPPELADLKED